MISVVMPGLNEERALPNTLWALFTQQGDYEMVVDDGGSRDRTIEIARSFPGVLVMTAPKGRASQMNTEAMEARGEWCLFTDADLSAPIEELSKLWNAVEVQGVEIAIGSRALDRSLIGVHQPGMRETAGKVFNAVMRLLIGLNISDTQCGFKLFRTDVAKEIFSRQLLDRFGFDVEVLYIADRRGYRIAEVPVRWNHVDGSKVGMLTGLWAFIELAEIRINRRRGRYR